MQIPSSDGNAGPAGPETADASPDGNASTWRPSATLRGWPGEDRGGPAVRARTLGVTPSPGGPMPSAQDVGRLFARGLPVATRMMTPQVAGGAFRQVLELAIDGTAKLPGAKAHASRQFQRHGGATDPAIDGIIDFHVKMAGAQGFVTNLGGLAALPVMYARQPGRRGRGAGPDGGRAGPPAGLRPRRQPGPHGADHVPARWRAGGQEDPRRQAPHLTAGRGHRADVRPSPRPDRSPRRCCPT